MGRLSDEFRNGDVDRESVVGFGRMLDETYGTKLFDDASLGFSSLKPSRR